MKRIFTLGLCFMMLIISSMSMAQESYSEDEGFEGKNLISRHADAHWFKLMNVAEPNLFVVQKAYDDYFKIYPFEKSKETRAFEFWKKHIVRQNYDEKGNVGKQIVNNDDLKLYSTSATTRQKSKAATIANWTRIPITPDMSAPWQSGCYTQGTCNMVAIHPTDTTKMIAAFIDGGTLWRTEDNCKTWTQCATNLMVRHFGSVVYCKSHPDTVYAGSSQGVIRSFDGGKNWMLSGYNQTASYPGGNEIWAMEVHADNAKMMVFAIGSTFYRTTNIGGSFSSKTLAGNVRDIRSLPGNPNVLFVTIKNGNNVQVLRSTDFGNTFAAITNGFPASISGYTGELGLLAVSPAEPNSVWVHLIAKETATSKARTYDIYKSTDGGVTFARMNITQDLTDSFWQGGWNQAFAVSDRDVNIMAGGAYSTYVTNDGGKTWFGNGSMGKTGPHSDVHGLVIRGNSVWSAGDGGFYKSVDYGRNYDHSVDDGVQSHCLWGFDQAWKNDIMSLGMYHGPTTYRDDAIYTGWYPAGGADAGITFVNKGDDRFIYASPWGLCRYTRSTSRNVGPSSIGITSINRGKNDMNDPDYYEKVYGGNNSKIMLSSNNSASYTDSIAFSGNVSDYIVSLTNNKVAYCRAGNTVMKTTDGGVTWSNVTPSSSFMGSMTISHIAVDPIDPQIAWITFGGKQTTLKVAKTTNGGTSWTKITTTGLPSYSVNCIVNQMGTNGDIYVGTDAGVYYWNNSATSWTAFSTNLPVATHVGWIKINYAKAKIRIAGQTGIWESDMISASAPIAHPTTAQFNVSAGKAVQFADMSVCRADATYQWTFPDATPATSTAEKPSVVFNTGGDKNITLTVTDANGSDTRTYNSFVRVRNVGEVAKTGWKVIKYDNQNSVAEAAANTIDGKTNTFWHTAWSGSPGFPHDLWIDMGKEVAIESFKYLPRQDGGSNGNVKGYEWYVSNDGVNWGSPLLTGEYGSGSGEKISTLATPVTARYFRFRPMSEISGNGFASAAEVGINGSASVISAFGAKNTLVQPGGAVEFVDKSAGNPTGWLWTFPGGTPSTSTEQNPVVTYATEGVYPVTLQASNVNGTDVITKNSYITVSNFVPQTGWKVVYVDSQETTKETTPATYAFDGSNSTFWGTNWSTTPAAPYPHELKIDMGAEYSLSGFNYVPRQDAANGRIKDYELYLSTDNVNWTLAKSGTWTNTAVEQAMTFTSFTPARYFRLVAKTEVNSNPWAAVAEIKMKLGVAAGSTAINPNSKEDEVTIYSTTNRIVVDNTVYSRGDVRIFDVSGRELFSFALNRGSNQIENVEEGIYIVKVTVNNSIISRKIMVR